MIKLFSLKQQKKDEEGTPRAGGSQKKASAAQLRITKGTCKSDVRHFCFQNTYHRAGKCLNNCKIVMLLSVPIHCSGLVFCHCTVYLMYNFFYFRFE